MVSPRRKSDRQNIYICRDVGRRNSTVGVIVHDKYMTTVAEEKRKR